MLNPKHHPRVFIPILVLLLPAVWLFVAVRGEASDLSALHRELSNRLAVLLVMEGKMAESVQFGKAAQEGKPDAELREELGKNHALLRDILIKQGNTAEIEQWQKRLSLFLSGTPHTQTAPAVAAAQAPEVLHIAPPSEDGTSVTPTPTTPTPLPTTSGILAVSSPDPTSTEPGIQPQEEKSAGKTAGETIAEKHFTWQEIMAKYRRQQEETRSVQEIPVTPAPAPRPEPAPTAPAPANSATMAPQAPAASAPVPARTVDRTKYEELRARLLARAEMRAREEQGTEVAAESAKPAAALVATPPTLPAPTPAPVAAAAPTPQASVVEKSTPPPTPTTEAKPAATRETAKSVAVSAPSAPSAKKISFGKAEGRATQYALENLPPTPAPLAEAAPKPQPQPARPVVTKEVTVKVITPAKTGYELSRPLLPQPVRMVGSTAQGRPTPQSVTLTAPEKKNTLDTISALKVTVNFKDAEIADVIRLLAEKAEINVISKKPIIGQTTVKFDNILVGTALDILLKSNGYFYQFKDNLIWVFRQGEEPAETKIFFLKNAEAQDILPLVANSLRQNGGGTAIHQVSSTGTPARDQAEGAAAPIPGITQGDNWNIQVDPRSNALIITAPANRMVEVAKLIRVLDTTVQNGRMEERIFNLKYIDRDTLEKAIKMVLPRFEGTTQLIEIPRRDAVKPGGKP